jgi:DNA-3-methyladenine glycosylase
VSGVAAGELETATAAAPLPRAWYDRSAIAVAPDLLGKRLVHVTAAGAIGGRIVETEAYTGPEDLAAHSARGRTPRTTTMFGEPGHLYVYLIYGLHHCLNVVCGPGDKPEAVLIRAVAIDEGEELVRARRGASLPRHRLAAGPGNVGAAFGIDRSFDGGDLLSGPVRVLDGPGPDGVDRRARIGVDYAGEWATRPFRFLIRNDPHISRR